MSFLTTLTRSWLTRTTKPFVFTAEYDDPLPYADCDNPGLYVHIPFCKQVCSFCPYCKQLYDEQLCSDYIDSLLREIEMVGSSCPTKKTVTSLYFGGGTPALAAGRLGEIIDALQQYFVITEGIGVELHPDNVNNETLTLLRAAGVTKLSIGIQSFSPKFQKTLGRKSVAPERIAKALAEVPFETVSMDFIFALPEQTTQDLRSDIETAFAIGANHIAIYPLIDFTFTDSQIKPMSKRDKRRLLDDITLYCRAQGYTRESIWTFSRSGNANYSSMTRDTFLGFGCSATTLLRNQFKINTFSVEQYISRIASGTLPTSLTTRFTLRQRMIYYLFWTAYSTQVDGKRFEQFFGVPPERMYGFELWLARLLGFVTRQDDCYHMTLRGAFYYHYYESFYTLAYIDKMWGIMRSEAFPYNIKL